MGRKINKISSIPLRIISFLVFPDNLCLFYWTGLFWSRAARWEPYYSLPPVLVMSHRTFDIDKTLFVSGLSLLSQREQTALLWLYPSCLFQSTVVQTPAHCCWLQTQQDLACRGKKKQPPPTRFSIQTELTHHPNSKHAASYSVCV